MKILKLAVLFTAIISASLYAFNLGISSPQLELASSDNQEVAISKHTEELIESNSSSAVAKARLMTPCNLDFSGIQIGLGDFTECGAPANISFTADVDTLVNIQSTINLPNTFVYKGNLTGATLISTTPLIIQPNIVDNSIHFTFDMQAQCGASDDTQVAFLFDFLGGNSNCQELSLGIPVRDITVLIAPEGTPGRNTTEILSAVLNENDTLISTIVQEGVGVIDSLFYFVDNHPLMSLEKVVNCETGVALDLAFTIGDRQYFWVGENETSIDGTDGFVRNEGIDICEIWKTILCPELSIPPVTRGVSTSCNLNPNTDICQNDTKTATLDFAGRVPEIVHEIDNTIAYDPTCIGAGPIKQAWILVNQGTAPAGNMDVYLTEFSGSTPIDKTTFTYRIGKNSAPTALPSSAITNTSKTGIPNCVNTTYANNADLNTRMTVNFANTNLAVGDTLYFDYLISPIPCTCNSCDVPRRLGTDISDMNVYTLCDDLVQNEILRSNIAWPYFDVDISSFMETPVTNVDGTVSTFSNTISNYNNAFLTNQGYNGQDDDERNEVYFNNDGGCADCYFEAIYILPNGLDWVGSSPSDITWRDDDGTLWTADEVAYTDHNGGKDTLIATWIGQEPNGFDPFNESSGIFFDYTPDCEVELAKGVCTPKLYTDEITRQFNWSSGNCPTCPVEVIECEEPITVVIKCPGVDQPNCSCDGFVQTYGTAERKNLYEPDPNNDGQPDAGSNYDENLLRRDRFLKGDSIEVKMGGYVSASGVTFSNFDYIYAIVDFPNTEFLPIGGTVTVFENGGSSYTCDVLTQQIYGDNKLVTDLSIAQLVANGCGMPSTYEDMDSIALTFYYSTTESFLGEIQQLTYRTRFFASDEPYGGAQYSCRLPIDYRITQVGTQSSFDYYNSNLRGFEGCDTGTPYYRGYARIGSRSIDFFPGEYVGNLELITQFQTNIPSGLVFDFFRIYIRRKNASGTNNLGSQISGFPSFVDIRADHSAITIVGNQLYLDLASFLQTQTGSPDHPYSDEGYSWSLQPYFIATCDLPEGPVENANMVAIHQTNETIYCSAGYTFEDTRTDLRYDGGAEIIVEAVDGNISIDQFPTCAEIRVTNNGNAVANNTWLNLNNLSNKLIIKSLTDITNGGNTLIPPSNFGLYELGDFSQNSHRLYEICVFANVCGTDSLNIISGYDCSEYPTNVEAALCSSEDVINFHSVAGSLTMIAKAPESEVVLDNLCDTVTYVVDLNAAGAGYLHDIKVDIQLPLDVNIVPGSFEIAYPTTATSVSLPPDSEFEPATDAIHLYGTTYQFDVSGNDPVLATDGLIGSAGSAFNSNVVNFRFKAATACGYGAGSRLFFEANGTEGCGNPLVPAQLDFSEKVKIFGTPAPFISEIEALPDTLSACGGGSTTLQIDYGINGQMATETEDSIRVILPPGLTYVPNSYNRLSNPSSNEPSISINSGLQVLYWGIGGLNPDDDAAFAFDIQASDIGQSCKDYQFIVQTFKSAISECSATGEDCNVRVISAEEIDNIYIDKPSLSIEVESAISMSTGMDEMVMIDFKITNTGSVETEAGNVVAVDLYADIDQNGRINKNTDLFLSQIDLDVTLSPGETVTIEGVSTIPSQYSCGFLAILDITKNCVCSQVTTGRIATELDLKLNDDLTVCSNEAQAIGPDNPNYTYEWVSLDGADLSAISPNNTTSPATFQYDNNTGQTIVWNYGLSIVRGTGCYTFDTIQVTIYPETTGSIVTTLCAPIPDCGDADTGFQLAGPIDGTDYQWSVQSGDLTAAFEDATSPTSKVTSTLSETTTFLLNYSDKNGCAAEFLQTVSLINCACTSLGDTVWYDLNVDGIQNNLESGIEGVTVFLYDANNLNQPIQSTTTNASGAYIFQPLPAANYVVRFDTLGNTSSYHLLVPTQQNIGDDELDSDADSLTGFTGAYFLSNGISNLTVDAGFYPAFDLALKKEINALKSPSPYFAGDTIAYEITVVNQGGFYPATEVQITDYIPADMTYIDGTNSTITSKNGASIQVTNLGNGQFELDQLPILDEVTFEIRLIINAGFTGRSLTNFAEISAYANEFNLTDIDSKADNNETNDAGGAPNSDADNYLNGNGLGAINSTDSATDEDDHDPANLQIQTVDLALVKKVDDTFNAQPVAVGELSKFDIIVINQGEIAVDSVRIVDHVPAGLQFDPNEPLNIANGWQADITTTLRKRILPNGRDTISIYLTALLAQNNSDYINASEIIAAYDTITGRDIAPYDIDSNPNSNTAEENAVAPNSTGDNDISSTGINDIGSEDDHDIEVIRVVYPDVALRKIVAPSVDLNSIKYNEPVPFNITVFNQGTMDADTLKVVDYIPKGLQFDATLSGNNRWTLLNDSTAITSITNVFANTQKTIKIWLKPLPNSQPNSWINQAEVSQFIDKKGIDRSSEDLDSQLDTISNNNAGGQVNSLADDAINGNGQGVINGIDPMTDQDNADPVQLEIFDLALTKKLESPAPYQYGDTLVYKISIYNQGNVPAQNIVVNDSLPAGLINPSGLNPLWMGTTKVMNRTITTTILPSDSTHIFAKAILVESTGGNNTLTNISEIISAQDTLGTTRGDLDSEGDTNTTNDAGGIPNSPTDDIVNGDGIFDEDDHDPAMFEVFDLALRKTTEMDMPMAYGDTISFDFTVFNQGNVAAKNIKVVDYLPCGFRFDQSLNTNWQPTVNEQYTHIITNTIQAGDSAKVTINLIPQPCNTLGAWRNKGEISSAQEMDGTDATFKDIDSKTDSLVNNDGIMIDNEIHNANNDEDDSDFEEITIFDLAQIKQLTTPSPYHYGDTLNYIITVYNQGNVPATNIAITDSIPAGLVFITDLNDGWTGAHSTYTTTIQDTIQHGDSIQVSINLRLVETTGGNGNYTNISEISASEDDQGNNTSNVDIDSQPDSLATNDAGGIPNSPTDDITNGDGIFDEDDHDPAMFEVFDLALRKTTEMDMPMAYGDTISFDFTVFNQGNVAAKNIKVVDYLPCGFRFDQSLNTNWQPIDNEQYTHIITDTIHAGDSAKVTINLIPQPCNTLGAWRNKGEISSAQEMDGTDATFKDIDSQTDSLVNNDGVMIDNEIHNANDDEDDSDFEEIVIFDLAQIKQLTTPSPYHYGDTLNYMITVYNQGNVPATNIEITDSIPAGLAFITDLNDDWTGAHSTYTTTIQDTIQHGDSIQVSINLRLVETTGGNGNYTNISEISASEDDQGNNTSNVDIDSQPDSLATNDAGGIPNSPTDDITNGDGIFDEDDHDPAMFEVFDLALRKTTEMDMPMAYGDTISFDFTVFNQGNVAAKNIKVVDYLPCGFRFDQTLNLNWQPTDNEQYTHIITDTIQAGDSAKVTIHLIAQPCVTRGAWRNKGEISSAQEMDGTDATFKDIDSQTDSLVNNDGVMIDNEIHNANDDEDDSDFEEIVTFDLAQIKRLVTPAPYRYDDILTYAITVYNQGNVAATNIEITDSIPAGLVFLSDQNSNWAGTDSKVKTIIRDTLQHGDSITVNIVFKLVQTVGGVGNYTNISEISACEDYLGNNTADVDFDSQPDTLATNDAGGVPNSPTDNIIHGDGIYDEDDHDPATIDVFDLALRKTSKDTLPYAYNDTITFDLSIYNQGSVAAKNIELSDYLPTGYQFIERGNPDWTYDTLTRIITKNIEGILLPGDSVQVQLAVQIKPASGVDAWKNIAEISKVTDTLGNIVTDIDSTPDSLATNDGPMKDDEINNDEDDEDDSDFHNIEVYDLALFKQVIPTQPTPIFVGDEVIYQLYTVNQGNLPAYDIQIMDYVPNELLFSLGANVADNTTNPNDWVLETTYPTYTIDELLPTDTAKIFIHFRVNPAFVGGDILNFAEINFSSKTDGGTFTQDIDSQADDNDDNDKGGMINSDSDDHIEDDANDGNSDGITDEDDHDPALINTVAAYPRIVNPCECVSNGLFKDEIIIFTTLENENWSLTENNGAKYSNLTTIPVSTTATPIGIENGFYRHTLTVYHENGTGYSGKFSNGKISFAVNNQCYEDFSCRVIIPPTDSTSTPPPPIPVCVNLINASNTPAIDTLESCEDCEFRSEGAEDAILYRDTIARNNVHTIYPPSAGQRLNVTFSRFDLAAGDTLFVYDGPDTLSNLVGKFSGAGISQTGGSISASCQPAINSLGCLTFQFKTNGDNSKGTGWVAKTSCETDEMTLIAPNNLNAKLLCRESYEIFTIEPAMVMSNCAAIQDSQLVRIYNEQQEIFIDTLIAFDEPFSDTFAIGQYFVDYKLKTDTTIATIGRISVQGPALVCNDAVTIPLGSACCIQILPDDLLENPCDTLTDSLYYYITLKGLDKNGQPIVLAEGGGKGGDYPILDKTQLTACGSTITAEIERRYFENTTLTFPNNGSKIISCETTVNLVDNSAPTFVSRTVIDTFKRCEIIMTEKGLDLSPPKAVDNCDSVAVRFENATILSGFDICDTTSVSVIWSATDQCGNQSQMTQMVVFIRPSLVDLVKAEDVVLSCGEDTKADFNDLTKTGIPSLQIGQVKNGQLIPSDTLALSTETYVCGYILQKREVELDNNSRQVGTSCGTKLFRYWDVVDWCNSVDGPMPIDTQFIELKDTISPVITCSLSNSLADLETVNLGANECEKVVQFELPQATDNCSEVTVAEYTVEQLVDSNWVKVANNLAAIALPIDTFRVGYRAFDSCSEQVKEDSCFRYFVIEDNTLPTPICTDVINLSLPQDSAQLHYSAIDNGSYDACGIVKYEVSRDQVNWEEKVGFGCADIHQAIKVYLRVTDKNGNQNICWMTVKPEDKIRPICSPLADQFGTCDEGHLDNFGPSTDANNNGQMDLEEWVNLSDEQIEFYNTNYGNPDCSDNVRCSPLVIEQQYQLLPKSCGQITVIRRYRAKDWQGQGNTSNWAEQTITISYQPDWSITLPADWQGECGDELPTPSLEIINGHCDALAYEVTEKTFTLIEGACLKTVRTFTIINWCLYQTGTPITTIQRKENAKGVVADNQTITAKDLLNNRALGTIGALQYSQVLKIQDHTAPIIKIAPVDDCISMNNCEQEKVFSISATDCNLQSSAALSYEWAVYLNNIKVDNGTGPSFTKTVSTTNNLRVEWKVTDACGNVAQANGQHYFVDCKKPTPYCLHGSAVNLMDNGKVAVWAKDLDLNSGDNCTTKEKLIYRIWHNSLGTAPTHIASIHALPENIEFTCSYLGNQVVRLYLIDAANNWDFCETYVNIQDNNQVCEEVELEHTDTLFANGKILSWTQQSVENVELNVESITQMTDVNGQFALPLAKGNNYTITPRKNTEPLNGVSTYDLVLISKHILGLKSFENPYQYIAADVNKSGSVTAYDMVILRQLILSLKTDFDNNESWRFVATNQMIDENNPLQQDLVEGIEVTDLQSTITTDFTAIKIGDVNGNARTNSLFVSESRQSKAIFEIKIQDQTLVAGQTYEVAFTSDQLHQIQGYQFSLDFTALTFEKLHPSLAKIEHFGLHHIQDGWLTTSWNKSGSGQWAVGSNSSLDATLFKMTFVAQRDGLLSEVLQLKTRPTAIESYDLNGDLMDIKLTFLTPLGKTFELYQNQPNPFDKATKIGFYLPKASPVTLRLSSETGQLLKEIKMVKSAGYQSIDLEGLDLPKGLIFYQLQTEFGTEVKKMLRVE